jgi:hypothetical protein
VLESIGPAPRALALVVVSARAKHFRLNRKWLFRNRRFATPLSVTPTHPTAPPSTCRWLSERYPLINQAIGDSTLLPEFENLYLDMNGIIHNATHGDEVGRWRPSRINLPPRPAPLRAPHTQPPPAPTMRSKE